jgi:hypothetical protein
MCFHELTWTWSQHLHEKAAWTDSVRSRVREIGPEYAGIQANSVCVGLSLTDVISARLWRHLRGVTDNPKLSDSALIAAYRSRNMTNKGAGRVFERVFASIWSSIGDYLIEYWLVLAEYWRVFERVLASIWASIGNYWSKCFKWSVIILSIETQWHETHWTVTAEVIWMSLKS